MCLEIRIVGACVIPKERLGRTKSTECLRCEVTHFHQTPGKDLWDPKLSCHSGGGLAGASRLTLHPDIRFLPLGIVTFTYPLSYCLYYLSGPERIKSKCVRLRQFNLCLDLTLNFLIYV